MDPITDIPSPRFPDIQSVQALLRHGKQLTKSEGVTVVEVAGDLVVKFGKRVYRSEALAMRLVSDSTVVPIPRFYAYFSGTSLDEFHDKERHCGYIVMDKVSGTPLVEVLAGLNDSALDTLTSQLRRIVSSLRSLKATGDLKPWGIVGRDGLFHGGYFRYLHRPFSEEQLQHGNPCRVSCTHDFLEYFAKACDADDGYRDPKVAGIFSYVDLERSSVFSHGDFVPENILVDEDTGSVTSIIDWELAGWYPYFWDDSIASIRASAYQGNLELCQRWRRIRETVIADGSPTCAMEAFCGLHCYAFFLGETEFPYDRCLCCS
ncbi:kinase-like domain-containing protein [Trametes meyenii]|nr:kinase-like domain-containing protein [Trametes meyenii]